MIKRTNLFCFQEVVLLSKKCKVIEFLSEKQCTVCAVSRGLFYSNIRDCEHFIGCETPDEKYKGDYLTLILLKNDCYSNAVTYKVKDTKYFNSFKEAAETVGTKTLGFDILSPNGLSSRMHRIFEPKTEYRAVVFELEEQPYPIFTDPPVTERAEKRISEFEALKETQEYLSRIRCTQKLSEEDERALVIRAIGGDIKAKKLLMENYLKTAYEIASHYVNEDCSLIKLVDVGNRALEHAINTLDSIDIVEISNYINWEIRREIMRQSSVSYGFGVSPEHSIDRMRKVDRTYKRMLEENDHEPTDEELAEELSYSLDTVNDYLDFLDEKSEEYIDFMNKLIF